MGVVGGAVNAEGSGYITTAFDPAPALPLAGAGDTALFSLAVM